MPQAQQSGLRYPLPTELTIFGKYDYCGNGIKATAAWRRPVCRPGDRQRSLALSEATCLSELLHALKTRGTLVSPNAGPELQTYQCAGRSPEAQPCSDSLWSQNSR